MGSAAEPMETTMDFAAAFLRGFEKAANAKDVFRNLRRRGKEKTATIIKPEIASRTEGSIYQSLAEKKGL
jgi:hypothetical protein